MAMPGDDERSLIRRADEELYQSKAKGKNRASIDGVRMIG
jgi:PleD family two-component response regulator